MPIHIVCKQCSEEFAVRPRDSGRSYCSFTCYKAYEAIHGRERQKVERIQFSCKNCGNSFSRGPGELREYHKKFGKDPLYCSRACSHIGRTGVETKACAVCNKNFTTVGSSQKRAETCSDPCRRALQRRNLIETNEKERPSAERPMTRRMMRGYVLLRFPSINGVRGEDIYEHRYVMEQHLGRKLTREETVHHKLKPTTNNDLSNLELFSSRHGPGQRVTEQVDWAVKILQDYPEFAREAGYELHAIPREPVERLFAEDGADVVHRPNVSAT